MRQLNKYLLVKYWRHVVTVHWPPAKRRRLSIILAVSVCLSVCTSVCLYRYVCMSDDNFRKPWRRKFIFTHSTYFHGLRVKFVYEYEGHRVKIKVTRAKKVDNSYFRNVKLRSAITPVLSNIEPWCLCRHGIFGYDGSNAVTAIFVTWVNRRHTHSRMVPP